MRGGAILIVGALLLTASLICAVPQTVNLGSIEGVVLRGESEDPASNIRVRLASPQGTGASADDPLVDTTDNQGKFSFQNLQPGDYRLLFESEGYVRKVVPGQESLKLVAGQTLRDLTVRLTPTGTISGRVVDRSGQPIGNVPVRLTGEALPREIATRSNDRGEYRFFYIAPGQYWVSAGQGSDANAVRSHGAATRFDEEFDLTYFPGVTDRNSSRALSVNPGEELPGTDIVMGDSRAPSVRLPAGQPATAPAGDAAPASQPPRGH